MKADAIVCVIDGDPAVRDSLATLIGINGRPVVTFATGAEFLEAEQCQPIGWVVCEAELPDISGIELFQRFHPGHPATRFALLMSRSDPAATAVARRCGIDAVFHKPLVNRKLASFVAAD